jgi:hypothetical protein
MTDLKSSSQTENTIVGFLRWEARESFLDYFILLWNKIIGPKLTCKLIEDRKHAPKVQLALCMSCVP